MAVLTRKGDLKNPITILRSLFVSKGLGNSKGFVPPTVYTPSVLTAGYPSEQTPTVPLLAG